MTNSTETKTTSTPTATAFREEYLEDYYEGEAEFSVLPPNVNYLYSSCPENYQSAYSAWLLNSTDELNQPDSRFQNQLPLYIATICRDEEAVKWLIDVKHVDIDATTYGRTALMSSFPFIRNSDEEYGESQCCSCETTMAEILLARGANISATGLTDMYSSEGYNVEAQYIAINSCHPLVDLYQLQDNLVGQCPLGIETPEHN